MSFTRGQCARAAGVLRVLVQWLGPRRPHNRARPGNRVGWPHDAIVLPSTTGRRADMSKPVCAG